MDSLPPQPIDSLPTDKKRDAHRKLALYHLALSCDVTSLGELAEKAEFLSIVAMQSQLEVWGLSKLLPPAVENSPTQKPDEVDHTPQGAAGAKGQDVLPASRVIDSLLKVLERLGEMTRSLKHRREVFRAGRFETHNEYGADKQIVRREDITESQWRELCEAYDNDSASEAIEIPDVPIKRLLGVSRVPPEPLATLIAVYELTDEPIEPLLEALHSLPETRLSDVVGRRKKLRLVAEQFAQEVRGVKAQSGRPHAKLDSWEDHFACRITELKDEGFSHEEIHATFAYLGFSLHRVKQLGGWERRF